MTLAELIALHRKERRQSHRYEGLVELFDGYPNNKTKDIAGDAIFRKLARALQSQSTDEKLVALGEIETLLDVVQEYQSYVDSANDTDANFSKPADYDEQVRLFEQRISKFC